MPFYDLKEVKDQFRGRLWYNPNNLGNDVHYAVYYNTNVSILASILRPNKPLYDPWEVKEAHITEEMIYIKLYTNALILAFIWRPKRLLYVLIEVTDQFRGIIDKHQAI